MRIARKFFIYFRSWIILSGFISFFVYALLMHLSTDILNLIEQSSFIGYIPNEQQYSLDEHYVQQFDDDEQMIKALKEEYDSFILTKQLGNIIGVYYNNYNWLIPLEKGNIFTSDQLESQSTFYISNSEIEGIKVGEPLINEKKSFVSLLSIERTYIEGSSRIIGSYYINIKTDYSQKMNQNSSYYKSVELERYDLIFYIFTYLALIQLFNGYYYLQRQKIAVYRLCGYSKFKILGNYLFQFLVFFTVSFILGFLLYININPQIYNIELFRLVFIEIVIQAFSLSLPIVIVYFLVLLWNISQTSVIDYIRGIEE